jgi:hypothetical protein
MHALKKHQHTHTHTTHTHISLHMLIDLCAEKRLYIPNVHRHTMNLEELSLSAWMH